MEGLQQDTYLGLMGPITFMDLIRGMIAWSCLEIGVARHFFTHQQCFAIKYLIPGGIDRIQDLFNLAMFRSVFLSIVRRIALLFFAISEPRLDVSVGFMQDFSKIKRDFFSGLLGSNFQDIYKLCFISFITLPIFSEHV